MRLRTYDLDYLLLKWFDRLKQPNFMQMAAALQLFADAADTTEEARASAAVQVLASPLGPGAAAVAMLVPHPRAIEALRQAGCDFTLPLPEESELRFTLRPLEGGIRQESDASGRSPLKLALELGRAESIHAALAWMDPTQPLQPAGQSWLAYALSHAQWEVAEMLWADPRVKNDPGSVQGALDALGELTGTGELLDINKRLSEPLLGWIMRLQRRGAQARAVSALAPDDRTNHLYLWFDRPLYGYSQTQDRNWKEHQEALELLYSDPLPPAEERLLLRRVAQTLHRFACPPPAVPASLPRIPDRLHFPATPSRWQTLPDEALIRPDEGEKSVWQLWSEAYLSMLIGNRSDEMAERLGPLESVRGPLLELFEDRGEIVPAANLMELAKIWFSGPARRTAASKDPLFGFFLNAQPEQLQRDYLRWEESQMSIAHELDHTRMDAANAERRKALEQQRKLGLEMLLSLPTSSSPRMRL